MQTIKLLCVHFQVSFTLRQLAINRLKWCEQSMRSWTLINHSIFNIWFKSCINLSFLLFSPLSVSLFFKNGWAPWEVEVVVNIVFYLWWNLNWSKCIIKLISEFLQVEGWAITLSLLYFLTFFSFILFQRIKFSVFLVNSGFVRLNSNFNFSYSNQEKNNINLRLWLLQVLSSS